MANRETEPICIFCQRVPEHNSGGYDAQCLNRLPTAARALAVREFLGDDGACARDDRKPENVSWHYQDRYGAYILVAALIQ